jgi:hypothetical protein
MAENFTLYLPEAAHEPVASIVRELAPEGVTIDGEAHAWHSITIRRTNSRLRLSAVVFQTPQDSFSRLILGTASYLSGVVTDDPARKEALIRSVSRCKMLVGVVADPAFSEDEGDFALISSITDELGGMIFNGSGMLDADGRTLLDADGTYDPDSTPPAVEPS